MTAIVTAYICWTMTCKNSLGLQPKTNTAACPRNIPLKTKVLIGDLVYECQDRTAKRLDGRYDLFFGYNKKAYDRAIKFGKQKLEVKILK